MMYNDYFGFKEAPFNVTPNPRFIFYGQKHRDAVSAVLYGIEYRKGFIQLTGEIGTGKTTICRVVLDQLKGTKTHTAVVLNPCMSDLLLLKSITEDFGIGHKTQNNKDCFDALNRFLLREFHKGFNHVLFIDESQNLDSRSLELVRLLSNLETNSEKLLQIVLVGQPELRELINQPSLAQLRQRISVRVHLTALDRHEVKEYIHHRLQVAGRTEQFDTLFSPEAMDLLYEYSKGVPRILNNFCDWALLAAFSRNQETVDVKTVEDAVTECEGASTL